MDADGLFELLNVFGSAFSEGSLSLSVSLLSFFGCSIDLWRCLLVAIRQWHCYVLCVGGCLGRVKVASKGGEGVCVQGTLGKAKRRPQPLLHCQRVDLVDVRDQTLRTIEGVGKMLCKSWFTYRLAAALPLGLLGLLGSIGRGYPQVVVPVRARACGRVGLFSTMTVEAVEMVAILVVRRIRLIDGHLVCHTQAGA